MHKNLSDITKHKVTKKYSSNEMVNQTIHWLERFMKVDKLSDTDKVLLTELIYSCYEIAFRAWADSVE